MFGDVRVGNGAAVELGSTVAVKYRGWLTNGTLIDDSQDKAFSFVEGEHRVIAGWEQGLLGMRAGGKRRLIVPPGQGYGSEAHDVVPANSTLIFDVELVEVK
jgi:peptidylprolyl isomerase